MSGNGTTKRVGEIFKVLGGGTPSTANPDFWKGPIPWATSADLDDDLGITPRKAISRKAIEASATNVVPGGSVVVATRVGLGKVGIAPTDICFSQDCQGLILDPESIDSKFAALQLKLRVQVFKHISRGTTIAGVTKKQLLDVEFDLPPIKQQREIVAEIEKQFTRLDAGVAALRRMQANLKRYRAAVLKAACEGRLVPTEAERLNAEGRRLKDFESGEQLLERILIERRQNWQGRGKYKEPAASDGGGLSPLPAGWTWATVEQLSARVQYGSSTKTNEDSTGVPVLRMGNIQEGKLAFDKLKYLPTSHDEFPELLLVKGDLLFNRTNSAELVGKTAVFRGTPDSCSFASYLIRVRLSGRCQPDFVGYYINSVFGRAWIAGCVSQQVGQANVNGTKLQALAIPLPPLAEQARIVAEVERRLSVVEELESVVTANLQRATRLRQSILQKAFTGELVVQSLVLPINVIELPKAQHNQRPNAHFARALLSAEIVHRLHREPTFGRIKHQKIFHLCEHIAQLEEIRGQYHREAAGPLDNKLIYANEAELKKQKWYQEVHRESYGHAYKPLANAGNHRKYVEGYWPDKLPLIEKLIELMRGWDTDRCEIFCTTYAAWNDLVIWGKEPTEVAILREILERWHDSKKRFPEDRWCKAIGWMRKKGFVPTGFGKPTKVMERG
jgi:type I restriction enzyme S subunit